jgi:hypothetical protein
VIPAEPLVTLIVVPSERFGVALRSLESNADTHTLTGRIASLDRGLARRLGAGARSR